MRKEFRKLKRIKKRGSFLKNRFFLFGIALAVSIELLFYGVVLFPPFQVQAVRVAGNEEVSEHKIRSASLDHLWKRVLFFPTASILFIDTQGIQDVLLESIPELEAVNIQREFPNTLTISVKERNTAALWCQPPHLIISGGGQELRCVAIDSNGVAFKEAEQSSETIVIRGQEQLLKFKEIVVAKNVLDAILYFAKEAKRRSLFVEEGLSFEIVSENQIHAHTGENWDVYFTQTQDLSWQVTKLHTVLENKILPDKRKKLEYIDVRFGDQAYFKYR